MSKPERVTLATETRTIAVPDVMLFRVSMTVGTGPDAGNGVVNVTLPVFSVLIAETLIVFRPVFTKPVAVSSPRTVTLLKRAVVSVVPVNGGAGTNVGAATELLMSRA